MCERGTLSDFTVRITCVRGCVGNSPLGFSRVCPPGVTTVKSHLKSWNPKAGIETGEMSSIPFASFRRRPELRRRTETDET